MRLAAGLVIAWSVTVPVRAAIAPPDSPDAAAEVELLRRLAGEVCETARSIMAEGVTEDHMIDVGVEIVAGKDGLVFTDDAVWYLRGMLVGCLQ